MTGEGNDDDYILQMLNESMRSSEGDYDSDTVLEMFNDNSDEDPDFVASDVDEVSTSDESNDQSPSTTKRGRFSSSTPSKPRPTLQTNNTRPQRLFDEVISDISDSGNDEDPIQQPSNTVSNWKPVDLIFNVYSYNPNNEPVGINPDLVETMVDCQPIDFFYLYFNNEVLGLLVEETNRYAQQTIQSIPHSPHGRLGKWTECTVSEMRQFFGIVMYMGLNVLPTIAHYWRNDALYKSVL